MGTELELGFIGDMDGCERIEVGRETVTKIELFYEDYVQAMWLTFSDGKVVQFGERKVPNEYKSTTLNSY